MLTLFSYLTGGSSVKQSELFVTLYSMMKIFLEILSLISAHYISITENKFKNNDDFFFLSGANKAWHWYDFDFGGGQWFKAKVFILNSMI